MNTAERRPRRLILIKMMVISYKEKIEITGRKENKLGFLEKEERRKERKTSRRKESRSFLIYTERVIIFMKFPFYP